VVRRYNDLRRRHLEGQRALRRRRGGRGLPRNTELTGRRALPDFAEWLSDVVKEEIGNGLDVGDDVMAIGFPPSKEAYTYKALRAYGNHFRICDVDGGCRHITFDCGVANLFWQGSRSSVHDKNIVDGQLSYVGTLTEILQLCYRDIHILLLKARWVQPNSVGRETLRHDEYGYLMANFERLQPANREPYVFPATVKQVFFSDDATHRGWKVVLDKEPRGVRCVADEEEPQLGPNAFAAGVQAETHINIQYTYTQAMAQGTVVADELVPTFHGGGQDHGPSAPTEAHGWAEESSEESDSASDHSCNGEDLSRDLDFVDLDRP